MVRKDLIELRKEFMEKYHGTYHDNNKNFEESDKEALAFVGFLAGKDYLQHGNPDELILNSGADSQ